MQPRRQPPMAARTDRRVAARAISQSTPKISGQRPRAPPFDERGVVIGFADRRNRCITVHNIRQDEFGACFRERHRTGPPDATRRTGDDDYSVFEWFGHWTGYAFRY